MRRGFHFFLKASTRREDSSTRRANFLIALHFANQARIRPHDVILLMANQAEIAAGANESDRGLLDRRGFEDAAHFEIVRADQAAVADLLAEDVGDPFFRERRGCVFFGDERKRGVRNHHEGKLATHDAIGNQVFGPKFSQRLLDAREFMMRVEVGFAESGKMFAAAEDSGIAQSAQEFAGVDDDLLRIGGDGSRTHHRARGFKGQVERGSEVDVEAESAAVGADDASMLAVEFAASGGEDLRG